MMKHVISLIAIAFLIISCSHGLTPNFPKDKNLTNPAEIIIIRNKNFMCGGQSTTIFLDGLEIAHIRTGEYVSVFVEPGVHDIMAAPLIGSGRVFSDNFEEGNKYYLLISLLELSDYEFNLFDVIFQTRPGCDFEIEKISEEKGLKRMKTSKNLLEMEKEPKIATEAAPSEKEKPQLAYVPQSVTVPRVSLREEPLLIQNQMELTNIFIKYNFFDRSKNRGGSFENVFIDNKDGTVTDKVTGLMWQKSGSSSSLENRAAKKYIKHLNEQRFAGHSDWRLPNVEQLASLIEKDQINGVYLDPVFSNKQTSCWTVDEYQPDRQAYRGSWVVNFKRGQIVKATYLEFQTGGPSGARYPSSGLKYLRYVKAVRSAN